MDIFEKCRKRGMVHEVREKGVYPYFHALESRQDVEVFIGGKRRIMLGSNNYLGLTTQPEEVEAGIQALQYYSTGCSGSRFLNGTLEKTRKAYDASVYCSPVLPPVCAPNECLIRTSLMATHTYPLMDEATGYFGSGDE